MAVRGVFAETRVSHDDQFRRRLANRSDRALDDSVFRISAGGLFVFRFGQTEEDDAADAHVVSSRDFFSDLVNGEVRDTRHRGNLAPHACTRTHEEWQYEILGREASLTHQRANGVSSTKSTRTLNHSIYRSRSEFKF